MTYKFHKNSSRGSRVETRGQTQPSLHAFTSCIWITIRPRCKPDTPGCRSGTYTLVAWKCRLWCSSGNWRYESRDVMPCKGTLYLRAIPGLYVNQLTGEFKSHSKQEMFHNGTHLLYYVHNSITQIQETRCHLSNGCYNLHSADCIIALYRPSASCLFLSNRWESKVVSVPEHEGV
jgi:hypothetical protein